MTFAFPNVRFGNQEASTADWREIDSDDDKDDDEELAETPQDVIDMLGFDPAKDDESKTSAANDGFALDRASVRRVDQDGHLRVEITPISKANVCPYYGREIPEWERLGLDPDRIYNLYRDPEELQAAAASFAGKPLLLIHTPVNANGHPREVTVGSVGDDVVFDAPYLKAPLTIWDGEAIDLINSGKQKDLSSSYRYRADMTSGRAPDGQNYDGIMRDIKANHVALVEKGRAGGDVMVNDSTPVGLAATNPNSGVPAGGVNRAVARNREKEAVMAGKSAKDAKARDEGLMGKLEELLKDKVSDEEIGKVCDGLEEMLEAKAASDEDADEKTDAAKKAADEETEQEKKDNESEAERIKAREKAEKADDDDDDKKKVEDEEDDSVSKAAMDTALRAAIADERKQQTAIREAERFVRPWVGDLAIAFDTADQVYKSAIEAQGRSVKDIHPSAYRAILEMLPKPGQQRPSPSRVAMDAAKATGFAERFPDAGRIRVSI